MLFRQFFVLALVAGSVLGYSLQAFASPPWKNVGKACLPEQGRMLKNQSSSCHCPPDSYCPKNASEWANNPRQPGFISAICCPRPKECDFNFTRQGGCGQGSFNKQAQDLCLQYDYDETFATSVADMHDKLKLRDAANTCLAAARAELVTLIEKSSTNQAALATWQRNYSNCTAPLRGHKGFVCADKHTINVCTTVVARNCGTSGDCVASSSRVTMANGSTKAITDIKVGDVLKGLTADNIVLGLSRIEKNGNSLSQINGEGGLMISSGHPLLTTDGWKAISPDRVEASDDTTSLDVGQLEIGDVLLGDGDQQETVHSITVPEGDTEELYNIAVDGDHTFIVNGVVVRGYKNTIEY